MALSPLEWRSLMNSSKHPIAVTVTGTPRLNTHSSGGAMLFDASERIRSAQLKTFCHDPRFSDERRPVHSKQIDKLSRLQIGDAGLSLIKRATV